jgi:hypothetical protein
MVWAAFVAVLLGPAAGQWGQYSRPMTVCQSYTTAEASASVVTGAVVLYVFGLTPLSCVVAVTLAALPGLANVWLRPPSSPSRVAHRRMRTAMRHRPVVRWSIAIMLFLSTAVTPWAFGASTTGPALSRYRSVTLGDSLPSVIETLKARPTDVRLVQDQPTLVEELTWRPQRYFSGATTAVDAVEEMVLTFHLGQLARIAVSYDRTRTEGMTDTDLTEAFTVPYGEPMLPATPSHSAAAVQAAIAQWSDGTTMATLRRDGYPRQLRFIIMTLPATAALDAALADGAKLTANQAPAKELARRAAVAADLKERDARLRRDNKAAFKP